MTYDHIFNIRCLDLLLFFYFFIFWRLKTWKNFQLLQITYNTMKLGDDWKFGVMEGVGLG